MNKDVGDSRRGLSSLDAMAVATRWAPTLQRCVWLDDDLISQLYSDDVDYEWISVAIGHESASASRDEMALAARATVRVWQLLATCRGFGVRENPHFWRSVVLAFWPAAATATRQALPSNCLTTWALKDYATLFQTAVFPRVQLRVAGDGATIDRAVSLFCGVETATTSPSEISRELDDAIASLAPFVHGSSEVMALPPPPPIELRLCFDLKQTSTKQINALVERVHEAQCVGGDTTFRVHIQSLYPTDFRSRNESDWTYASTLRVPLSERTLALDTDWATARDVGIRLNTVLRFREALRWSLQLRVPQSLSSAASETSAGVQHLTFMKGCDDQGMPALCSALPHTQCLESLMVKSSGSWGSHNDILWLGYALFHPDTSASTWRRLMLSRVGHNRYVGHNHFFKTPSMLHMMARGNNLLANCDAPSEFVDYYFSATIQAGAVIRLGFRDGHTDRLEEPTRMDVCVTSTNLEELPDMVTVVVPGFGLGRIARDDVVSIEARAPGRPRLSAVNIEGCDLTPDDIVTLLEGAATTLQYVDLDPFEVLIRWRPSRCALVAFLSVVTHYRRRESDQSNAVARLDRDLMTLIASFGDQELCVSP
ncbi:hypothetical protein PINS_up007669 [Pythium insidiosum]|nr:hypothetical protein PINS_up007669 [Pythium insidiosum]